MNKAKNFKNEQEEVLGQLGSRHLKESKNKMGPAEENFTGEKGRETIYELFNCMKNFIKLQNIRYIGKLTFMSKENCAHERFVEIINSRTKNGVEERKILCPCTLYGPAVNNIYRIITKY